MCRLHAVNSACLAIGLAMMACSPASITRIGPRMRPQPPSCSIEILAEGETPSRPYRNVGMVSLENCPDYQRRPCSEWLREAACELGGHVAYIQETDRPDSGIGPVTVRVVVGAYASALRADENDPIHKSRTCNPPCATGERCIDGACKNAADCEAAALAAEKKAEDSPAAERCTE